MKNIIRSIVIVITLVNTIFLTGCWNYREIDKLAIVAGMAVDQGTNGQYIVTVEIAQISGGKDSKTTSKTITMEGKTMFDAVRNGISLAGQRLYWNHSKVLILSKKIASGRLIKVTDWYIRDSEPREDVNILISEAESAKEIFEGQAPTEDIKSLTLEAILKNQVSLSKAPSTNLLDYAIESQTKGASTVVPIVNLKETDGKKAPQIMGSAIIKKDKLVGFLDGEETKGLMFIRNEAKGGVLAEGIQGKILTTPVSLEIFSSKTKVTPVTDGKNIKMNVSINIVAAIDEIEGTENYIDENGRMKLEKNAEDKMKNQIKSLIRKIQSKYDADIFKFGTKLQEDDAKTWKRVGSHWDEVFRNLTVNVKARVHIKNSAMLSKPLKVR